MLPSVPTLHQLMVLSFSFPPRDCVALLAAPDKKLIGDCRWNESQKRKEEEEADGAFFWGERKGGGDREPAGVQ